MLPRRLHAHLAASSSRWRGHSDQACSLPLSDGIAIGASSSSGSSCYGTDGSGLRTGPSPSRPPRNAPACEAALTDPLPSSPCNSDWIWVPSPLVSAKRVLPVSTQSADSVCLVLL